MRNGLWQRQLWFKLDFKQNIGSVQWWQKQEEELHFINNGAGNWTESWTGSHCTSSSGLTYSSWRSVNTTEVVCDPHSLWLQWGRPSMAVGQIPVRAHPDFYMETLVCVQSMSVPYPNLEAPAASALWCSKCPGKINAQCLWYLQLSLWVAFPVWLSLLPAQRKCGK